MRQMTMRERMLAVIRGEEHDRVPFVQYDNFAAPNEEIWAALGRNNMGLLRWCNGHRLEHPNCRFESEFFEQDGLRHERRVLHTPAGQISELRYYEPTYGGSAWKKHFVEGPEDYCVLLAYLRDVIVCEDYDRIWQNWRELGDDGLPLVVTLRTPYQQMWIYWVGLEALSYHRADWPELVEECMVLLADIERRIFAVLCRGIDQGVPIPMINFPDNITAPAVGPHNFGTYCVPLYQELAGLLEKRHVPVYVHMDGDLKPLWDLIALSGVRGLDSFTPPPDTDTSAAQALALWPYMRLGLNFPSSVHITPPENVYRAAWEILQEAGHSGQLWIQISENVPPGVWRQSFPQIVRAIEEFGPPKG